MEVKDGDTYLIKDNKTVYTIRLHWADCPEIAHNSKQVDQPFGKEARDYIKLMHLNHQVTVRPVSTSYGRIVGDVQDNDIDLASELVTYGLAQVDYRYKPSVFLIVYQNNAKLMKLGQWSLANPIPPKEWRDNGYKPTKSTR